MVISGIWIFTRKSDIKLSTLFHKFPAHVFGENSEYTFINT